MVHQEAAGRAPIGEEHFEHGQKAAGEGTYSKTQRSPLKNGGFQPWLIRINDG